MRQALIVAVTGLIAGAVGALLAGRLTTASAPPAKSEDVHPAPPSMIIIPPGWNLDMAARLDRVEQELAPRVGSDGGSAFPLDQAASDDGLQHEAERAQHYQSELATQAQMVAEHATERLDRPW